MKIKVSIVALEGAVSASIFGVFDLLAMANQVLEWTGSQTWFAWEIIQSPGQTATTSSGFQIEGEKSFNDGDLGDVIFLPAFVMPLGQVTKSLQDHGSTLFWLEQLNVKNHAICACCTSVFLLAEAGLLNGRNATCTWWALADLKKRYPKINVRDNSMLVADERFITSAGPFSYTAQVLHIIEEYVGVEVARLVAKMAVVEPGKPVNGIFSVPTLFLDTQNPDLAKAEEIIQQNLQNGITVPDLAAQMGMSERTLHRRLAPTNLSPSRFITLIRFEVAKTLLETTTLPLSIIAEQVGFENDSSFRKAFKLAIRATPTAYRRRMNPLQRTVSETDFAQ